MNKTGEKDSMCRESELIQSVINKVENSWTSYSAYLFRLKMKDSLRTIKMWYSNDERPKNLNQILEDYIKKGRVDEQIAYGYMYYLDEIEKFIRNPETLWDFYDGYLYKDELFIEPFIEYSTNREQNNRMFLREVFYSAMNNIEVFEMSKEMIALLDKEGREAITDYLKKIYSEKMYKHYIAIVKSQLISALENVLKMFDTLCVSQEMRNTHNGNVSKLGLNIFAIPNDVPLIESGKILGIDFENCSIFQLEAMLCHYSNRLEKIRENLGKGLFAVCYLCDKENPFDIEIDEFSEQDLLDCQKEYAVISRLHEDMYYGSQRMITRAQRFGTDEPTAEAIYDMFLNKYEKAYAEFFGYADKDGSVLNDDNSGFKMGCNVYGMTSSFHKHFNYLTKRSLMEDLIIQAERMKVNWGLMKDGEHEYRLKRNVLIGMDIPGLNMPLRLHYPLKALRRLMHDYLQIDEIPLYVGQNDFDINGKMSGTQFLLPITPKQKKTVKVLAKSVSNTTVNNSRKGGIGAKENSQNISEDGLRRAKHINYMQLPNTAGRILSEKTNKSQIYPDYINMFTGDIRRTPRRNV